MSYKDDVLKTISEEKLEKAWQIAHSMAKKGKNSHEIWGAVESLCFTSFESLYLWTWITDRLQEDAKINPEVIESLVIMNAWIFTSWRDEDNKKRGCK